MKAKRPTYGKYMTCNVAGIGACPTCKMQKWLPRSSSSLSQCSNVGGFHSPAPCLRMPVPQKGPANPIRESGNWQRTLGLVCAGIRDNQLCCSLHCIRGRRRGQMGYVLRRKGFAYKVCARMEPGRNMHMHPCMYQCINEQSSVDSQQALSCKPSRPDPQADIGTKFIKQSALSA